MIRDEDGDRISAKRLAKIIVVDVLCKASEWMENYDEFVDTMTALEIAKVDDSVIKLVESIDKSHRLGRRKNADIRSS